MGDDPTSERSRTQHVRVSEPQGTPHTPCTDGRHRTRQVPVRGRHPVCRCADGVKHGEGSGYFEHVADDTWANAHLADLFVDGAYATVKGHVRTFVLHHHLMEHLASPPATVLDVGGGAGHQSFPLAQAGYEVTVLDPSGAMLDKARSRLALLSNEVQERVRLVQAKGEDANEVLDGQRFAAVLCHGVLVYVDDPAPLIAQLCQCVQSGGIVSIMTANAHATAVQPAMEQRWRDALTAFDTTAGIGVLGVRGRADTVEEGSALIATYGVEPVRWYGVWLFIDWLEFSGSQLDPTDDELMSEIAAVELEASRRDPYRQLSRVFHLLGQKA